MTAELLMAIALLCEPPSGREHTPAKDNCQIEIIKCLKADKANGDALAQCYLKYVEKK